MSVPGATADDHAPLAERLLEPDHSERPVPREDEAPSRCCPLCRVLALSLLTLALLTLALALALLYESRSRGAGSLAG
jgi:hypothetical protein